MTFIEKVGQRRVGFYCWKLFIINYFRCYEVNNDKFLTRNDFDAITYIKFFSSDSFHTLRYFPQNNTNVRINDSSHELKD